TEIAGILQTALVPFPIGREKQPVLSVVDFGDPDGAAQIEAVLILLEGGLGGPGADEVVRLGVERAVAEKLEERSMKTIGAGLRGDVDLGSFAAELGGVNAALHLEFLNGVERGKLDVKVEIRVGVGYAVEGVVIPGAAHACHREVLIGAIAALPVGC